MNYLIGIDVGTSAAKTVLFDDKGNIVASASREYPLYQPHNGWAEQRPEDWRDAVLDTVTSVVKQSAVKKEAVKKSLDRKKTLRHSSRHRTGTGCCGKTARHL